MTSLTLRQRIARLLRNAAQSPTGRQEPMSPEQIAELLSSDLTQVRSMLSRLVDAKQIRNVGTHRAGLYLDGPPEPVKAKELPERYMPQGVYTGERPLPLRPGAMDAYALPSRQADGLHPYRPPMIVGSFARGV